MVPTTCTRNLEISRFGVSRYGTTCSSQPNLEISRFGVGRHGTISSSQANLKISRLDFGKHGATGGSQPNLEISRFGGLELAGMVQFATANQTWKFPGLGWLYGTTRNGQLGSKFSLHGHSEQKFVFHEANSFQKRHFGQICTKKGTFGKSHLFLDAVVYYNYLMTEFSGYIL